ncbi:hypothetical protein HDV57DRAFT_92199 [Trichoderma longibrachiatum]
MLRLLPLCLCRFASFLPFRLSDYVHCFALHTTTRSDYILYKAPASNVHSKLKKKSYITNIHACMKPAIALYPDKARHGRWFTKAPINSPSPPGRAAARANLTKQHPVFFFVVASLPCKLLPHGTL